jgi:hypothetical protein
MELQGKDRKILYRYDGVMAQVGWMEQDGRVFPINLKARFITDTMVPIWVKVE